MQDFSVVFRPRTTGPNYEAARLFARLEAGSKKQAGAKSTYQEECVGIVTQGC